MRIHIITIFPESFNGFLESSIIGNAIKKKLIEVNLYKLNDFSNKKFKHVDDKAYGMHGQVISPEPLYNAIKYIKKDSDIKVVYMSPSGDLLRQDKLEKYKIDLGEEFIMLCGHYEGIDQRIIDLFVDYEISIGEYILTSGELASQVFIDSLARLKEGVIGNKQSIEEESFGEFFERKKEHPVYTRPKSFMGIEVPKELTSGNHKKIKEWKFNNLKV